MPTQLDSGFVYHEPKPKATCVVADGPFPDQNECGDEYPYWVVALCNDELEQVVQPLTKCFTFEACVAHATKLAAEKKLALVIEASRP